jgi:hypothetical protein
VKRPHTHLTYANVVATLALFIALAGGTAFAAKHLLPKNSVGTKQLKNGSVTGAKVKDGSITSSKIALSTLGTVPNAAHADSATSAGSAETAKIADIATNAATAATATNAQSLQGLSPAQIAALAKLTCPADTELVAGTCFETTARPAASWETAVRTCGKAGRFLPNASQLTTFDILGPSAQVEWSSELQYFSGTEPGYRAVGMNIRENSYSLSLRPIEASGFAYRCIVPPTN